MAGIPLLWVRHGSLKMMLLVAVTVVSIVRTILRLTWIFSKMLADMLDWERWEVMLSVDATIDIVDGAVTNGRGLTTMFS